jgi:hypothetical protein
MIECSECSDNVWCNWDEDRYICRNCYLAEGNSYQDWEDLSEDNRRYRQQKRMREADEAFEDL